MTLESQVCSLQLARRLKELNVIQESLFWWTSDDKRWSVKYREYNDDFDFDYSAYTVTELGWLLPSGVKSFVGSTCGDVKNWVTEWWQVEGWDIDTRKFANTEADARAQLLIYLLENHLI